jgi:hypothetical protein
MGKGFRDATTRKKFANARSGMKTWVEILSVIALAVAAELIHEAGHSIATRLLTGVWPKILGRPPRIGFRYETGCSDCPGSQGPGCPCMVGPDLPAGLSPPSVAMGSGRTKPDDGNRSRDLVRLTCIDSARPRRPRRLRHGKLPGVSPWMLATVLGIIIGRQPFSSVDTSGCPDHRPCERPRRRSRSFGLVISCSFRSRRDAASHTAL